MCPWLNGLVEGESSLRGEAYLEEVGQLGQAFDLS